MATTDRYKSVVSTLDLPQPAWVTDAEDSMRVAAYDGYQQMYDNVPDTFKTAMRGTNDKPLYAPGAKRIVETKNRYLARDWGWVVLSVLPAAEDGTPGGDALAIETLQNALAVFAGREELPTKFYSLKRSFLTKGDACWLVSQDLGKPAGSQISITELDPRQYFRIQSE